MYILYSVLHVQVLKTLVATLHIVKKYEVIYHQLKFNYKPFINKMYCKVLIVFVLFQIYLLLLLIHDFLHINSMLKYKQLYQCFFFKLQLFPCTTSLSWAQLFLFLAQVYIDWNIALALFLNWILYRAQRSYHHIRNRPSVNWPIVEPLAVNIQSAERRRVIWVYFSHALHLN